MAVLTHVMSYDVDWDRLGTMGRASRTRETLPDFHEWCWVTRHPLLFHGLTGCQRTPGNGGSQILFNHICFFDKNKVVLVYKLN